MAAITNKRAPDQQALIAESDRLYERFGKPLEKEHRGEYLAVSKGGQALLAARLFDALEKADERFGSENFIFKIGDKAEGEFLRLPQMWKETAGQRREAGTI